MEANTDDYITTLPYIHKYVASNIYLVLEGIYSSFFSFSQLPYYISEFLSRHH